MELEKYKIDKIKNTAFIWKFLSIENFLSIVLNYKLYFTRLDKFEDNLEGIEPEFLLLNHTKNALSSLPPFNEILKSGISVDYFPTETSELQKKIS